VLCPVGYDPAVTHLPPLLPTSPPSPTTPARTSGWPTALAWVVILAAATYVIVSTVREKRAGASSAKQAADFGFHIAARYALGAHHALGARTAATTQAQPNVFAQVTAAVRTRDDRVRNVIIVGDVLGSDLAAKAIDSLPMPSSAGEDVEALRALYEAGSAAVLTDAQRRAILVRHGWFGELALSYGLPDDDPVRRAALRPALRTFWTLLGATAVLLGALALGLGLLITSLVRWIDGSLVTSYRPPDRPTGPFVEAFAAYLAGMAAFSALARLLFAQRIVATWFVLVTLPAVALWPLLRGISRGELRAGLGWQPGRGAIREIAAGVAGYFAGLPVLAAGAVVTLVLQRFSGSDTSHPIVNEVVGGSAWRAVRLFMLAAVWAPVVEETMFRGALYHHLRARLPWPLAAGLVAVLFAAIHPQGWAAIPVLGAIGFWFAVLREWRGSVIASATAHGINNGAVTMLLVMMLR
jgi:membrane protease YdiL (CAAX protease family)